MAGAGVVYGIYSNLLPNKIDYDTTKNNNSAIFELNAKKDGCYVIGFASFSNQFFNFGVKGKYKIEFFDENNKLIDTKFEDGAIMYTMRGGRSFEYKKILMHGFKVPYKNKYRDLKIKFSTLKTDPRFANIDEDIYLFWEKSFYYDCYKDYSKIKKKRRYGITKKEINKKLKPLFEALHKKDFKTITQIFRKDKIKIDVKMIGKREPIHYAALTNDTRTLRYLLRRGAKVNAKDTFGKTPLHYAVEHNAVKTARILLKNGANIKFVKRLSTLNYVASKHNLSHITNEMHVMRYIIKGRFIDMMELFFKYGYDQNTRLSKYSNLFSYAIQEESRAIRKEKRVLNLLLEKEYNPRKKSFVPPKKDSSIYKDYQKYLDAIDGRKKYKKMIKILKRYGAKLDPELEENKRQRNIRAGRGPVPKQ